MVRYNERDAANTRASTRSRLGLSRETHQARTENYPHPSIGGTRGFPMWVLSLAMEQYYDTICYLTAANRAGCCTRTIKRWEERTLPYRMVGGLQHDSLTGADQLMLAICLFIYLSWREQRWNRQFHLFEWGWIVLSPTNHRALLRSELHPNKRYPRIIRRILSH